MMTMLFRTILPAALIAVAAPANAWTESVEAGAYRVTATMGDARAGGLRPMHLTLAPHGTPPATAMTVHAWFIDSAGLILGPAAIDEQSAQGFTLTAASAGVAVPPAAAAIVVLAEPKALRSAAAGSPATTIAQIALPADK